MLKELRKIVTFDEDIYSEGGKEANPILRIIGVAAVLSNPWKGQGFVEDLQPEIKRIAPVMGKALTAVSYTSPSPRDYAASRMPSSA